MTAIALDTSFLYTDIGFGTYTDALVRLLPPLDKNLNWHFISNDLPESIPAFSVIPDNRKAVSHCFPGNVREHSTRYKRRILWSNMFLPRYLKQNQVDLFHSIDNISLPLWHKPCRFVLTLHDLIPLLFPGLVELKNAAALRLLMPRVLHQADRIICDSEATRNDLVSRFPKVAGKAVTIPLGVDHDRFCPLDDDRRRTKLAELRTRYEIQEGYILTVASLNPRRNLERLLEAFRHVHETGGERDRQLVVAGVRDYRSGRLPERVKELGLGGRVLFLGHVPRSDVPALYQCAACTVCVSLYEGFGFPVLESLACGTPVVASETSSLPEVGGRVAGYVDPYDPTDIARGLTEALQRRSEQSRQDRISWAKGFSWEVTAQKTYQLYQHVLAES